MNENNEKKLEAKKGKRKYLRDKDGLTIKQEAFAQKLASGMHFAQAFREAYNCDNWKLNSSYKKGFSSKDHPKVQARVKELREQIRIATEAKLVGERLSSQNLPVVNEAARANVRAVERVLIDRNKLTEMLIADRDLARENAQVSAAVGSVKVLAQLHGLISDNRDAAKQLTAIEQMTVDQLRDFILQELPQVGLSPSDVGLDFVSMNPNPKALN